MTTRKKKIPEEIVVVRDEKKDAAGIMSILAFVFALGIALMVNNYFTLERAFIAGLFLSTFVVALLIGLRMCVKET